jgi:DNA invertase Pin-like site-specific DNA recombinase
MKCVDIEKLVHSAYRDELPNQSVAFGVGERLQSTLLAAIAEFERELIRERTNEGRKRVMANGVKFGRKPDPSPHPAQRLGLAALGGSTICP